MSGFEFTIVLVSAAVHALWSVSIKGSKNPVAFNLIQSIPLCIIAGVLLVNVDLTEIPTTSWWWLAGTSICHGLYLYWLSRAFESADLSLVYPIARSTPAFLPIFAVLLLNESLSLTGIIGIAVVVVGVWTVQLAGAQAGAKRRGFAEHRAWLIERLSQPGLGFAYLTLAATVGYGLFDKAVMAELHTVTWTSPVPRALAVFALLALGYSVVYTALAARRVTLGQLRTTMREEWPMATAAAIIGIVGYGLILHALSTAPASYVVAVRQSSVLFVLLISVFFLRERPGPIRAIGALATVAGVAVLAFA